MQEAGFCVSRVVQRLMTFVIRNHSALANARYTSCLLRLSSRCRSKACISIEGCSRFKVSRRWRDEILFDRCVATALPKCRPAETSRVAEASLGR
jgi:hypothetical protein